MPVTLTWTGHATWLIDTGAGVLLIDPFFDECPTSAVKAGDVACDAILVAIAKRTGAKVLCNWEIGQWLGGHGVTNVQPMNLGGSAAVPGGTAKMELAWHSSSLPDGTYAGHPCGWLLDVGGRRIYVAGDTALFSDMERIGRPQEGRGLDVAVLPIGDLFTMGPADAREAVRLLKPKLALPSHYGTWPPIEQDAAAWARGVAADGVAAAQALAPGGSVTV